MRKSRDVLQLAAMASPREMKIDEFLGGLTEDECDKVSYLAFIMSTMSPNNDPETAEKMAMLGKMNMEDAQ